MPLLALLAIPVALLLFSIYLWLVNRSITTVPATALPFSPHRWTVSDIEQTAARLEKDPINTLPHLPPPTGRRYIVVGGSGLVGGWIVLHLLQRGEDPANIRIVDIRRPVRKDMLSGKPAQVGFVAADVQDSKSVGAAFAADWPDSGATSDKGITVFHTVACIRFYERHSSLVSRSSSLNVDGTRNVLEAAQQNGVDILVYTSSASIPVPRTQYWIWPWQRHAKTFVQLVRDDVTGVARKHKDCFSNYSYTKALAEKLVCDADSPSKGFRTGCVRPGNAIFGPGGDLNAGAYLVRGMNPSWAAPMIQSFTYVENASYAHLLYEQRLLENQSSPGPSHPDVGGKAFAITDRGNPISYGDLYLALSTLTGGKVQFPSLPPAPLLFLATLIEWYYIAQSYVPRLLPAVQGDLRNLQPAMFSLVTIHMKVDDSKAQQLPQNGGLGYQPPFSTLEGVCHLVEDHLKNVDYGQEHQRTGGGITLGFRAKN